MSVRHRVTSPIPRLAAGASFVCLMVSPIAAQNAAQPAAPAAQATDTSGFERVVLTAGRSTVLNTPFDVTRIAVTNPAVADAVVVQPREVLIDGKSAGTVSLIVWGGDERRQYRRRGRSRRDDAPADVSAALSGRGHPRRDERREHHPHRQRVEQRRHAARRRDRRRDVEQDRASSTCCSCPAARRASR